MRVGVTRCRRWSSGFGPGENIVSYSMAEIKAKLAAGEGGIDWERVNSMTDEEIERIADEENRETGFSDDWYKYAVPVLPAGATPEGVEKRRITIRLDEDIIEFFQQAGRGYQTRINGALRIVMNKMTGKAT